MLNSWKNENAKSETELKSDAQFADKDGNAETNIAISVPKTEEPKQAGNSTIDAFLTMRGDLESDGDILVKGKVFGNVSCQLLIVDESANIEGGVNAKEVVIRGKVNGVIKADKVRLDKSAEVRSDIYQNTFVAEEGAQISGNLKSLKEAPKDAANPPISVVKHDKKSAA